MFAGKIGGTPDHLRDCDAHFWSEQDGGIGQEPGRGNPRIQVGDERGGTGRAEELRGHTAPLCQAVKNEPSACFHASGG